MTPVALQWYPWNGVLPRTDDLAVFHHVHTAKFYFGVDLFLVAYYFNFIGL